MINKIQSRFIENIHVLLWLLKDTCWAMDYKLVGTFMIFPTVLAAVWLVYLTRATIEIWVNIAVLFWIIANATWMAIEFYQLGKKEMVLPFFVLGLMAFGVYLYRLKVTNE